MTRTFIALGIALIASASPASAGQTFDRAVWKADFERIKLGLAQGYANLDWQVDYRGLNLKRADGQIGGMLDRAQTDAEAMLALTKLVDAFRDPHLSFQPGAPPESARRLPPMSSVDQGAVICREIDEPRARGRLPFASAPGWTPVGAAPFPGGLIGTTGFLRIPSFDEDRFAPACSPPPTYDPYARRLAYRAALNRLLLDRIARMRAMGMTRLVIDLTGNGGGSEWSSELAGLLAGGRLERTAPRLVAPSCDRTGIWRGEKVCSPYAAATVETIDGKGAWTGPLVLLTDRHTASAAEEFVTWLRDNGRARSVGERTLGAGCGYVDGGSAIALTAAPVHLMIPNCSRYTRAGLNEIEGLAPDVPIDWALAKPEQALAAVDRGFR